MNPARPLGPDIVANGHTGWWVYVAGPSDEALTAMMIIGVVRGLPDKEEREAAEGAALPVSSAQALGTATDGAGGAAGVHVRRLPAGVRSGSR